MLRIRNDLIQGLKLLNIFIPHIKEMLIIICFQSEIKNLYPQEIFFNRNKIPFLPPADTKNKRQQPLIFNILYFPQQNSEHIPYDKAYIFLLLISKRQSFYFLP